MNVHLSDLGWTAERVELLKKRWVEGLSAVQIAEELGGGVTRNAVIGKIHRLKLERHPLGRKKGAVSVPRQPKPVKPALSKPRPVAVVREPIIVLRRPIASAEPADEGVDVTHLVGLLELGNRSCRWPHGDPLEAGFGFCGRPIAGGRTVLEGQPYCERHERMAAPTR